eukprot:gene6577-7877_t
MSEEISEEQRMEYWRLSDMQSALGALKMQVTVPVRNFTQGQCAEQSDVTSAWMAALADGGEIAKGPPAAVRAVAESIRGLHVTGWKMTEGDWAATRTAEWGKLKAVADWATALRALPSLMGGAGRSGEQRGLGKKQGGQAQSLTEADLARIAAAAVATAVDELHQQGAPGECTAVKVQGADLVAGGG